MKRTQYIIIFTIIFLLSACARIVTPKGGDKDITPPSYKSSNPKPNALNFHSKEIRIDFDEYIVLDNANQKLIISPPLKHKPEITSKLKSLYIKNIDSLQENTTYIFDFGDAITDFTEGNRLPRFSFSFSTGNTIDTMECKGKLLDAYSLKAAQGKYVALYTTPDKSYQQNNLPEYITRSDSSGNFHFSNIKGGKYYLVAYDDNNQNLIYDLPTEGSGFLSQAIEIKHLTQDEKKDDLEVLFSKSKDTIQKLETSKLLNEREIMLAFSCPITDSFHIEFLEPMKEHDDFILEKISTDTNARVNIYAIGDKIFDSVDMVVSDKNGFSEKVSLEQQRRKKKEERRHFRFMCSASSLPYYEKLSITTSFPINEKTSMPVPAWLITEQDSISISFYQDSLDIKTLVTDYRLKENTQYRLFIDSSVAENYKGEKNDSLSMNITTDSQDDYGRFFLSLSPQQEDTIQLILSLYDSQGKQIGKDQLVQSLDKKILFDHLKEGVYRLRAITDDNANGKWDGNSYLLHQQAEKVQYFDKHISIRKGWDLEEDWHIEL